jgi:hypothetical protein
LEIKLLDFLYGEWGARSALLTQFRWEIQRIRDEHHYSDAQIRDWLRPQRLPEDICAELCATPSGAKP